MASSMAGPATVMPLDERESTGDMTDKENCHVRKSFKPSAILQKFDSVSGKLGSIINLLKKTEHVCESTGEKLKDIGQNQAQEETISELERTIEKLKTELSDARESHGAARDAELEQLKQAHELHVQELKEEISALKTELQQVQMNAISEEIPSLDTPRPQAAERTDEEISITLPVTSEIGQEEEKECKSPTQVIEAQVASSSPKISTRAAKEVLRTSPESSCRPEESNEAMEEMSEEQELVPEVDQSIARESMDCENEVVSDNPKKERATGSVRKTAKMDEAVEQPKKRARTSQKNNNSNGSKRQADSVIAKGSPATDMPIQKLSKFHAGQIKEARKALKDLDPDWTKRSNALTKLEKLISEEKVFTMDGWKSHEDKLREPLTVQLSDLRSSIIKQACQLLVSMAEHMGDQFDDLFANLLPAIFKNLYVSIKVISVSADQCVKNVLEFTHSLRILQPMLDGFEDSHAVQRQRCVEYLTLYLKHSPSEEDFKQYLPSLEAVCINATQDADGSTRVAGRQLYEAFCDRWKDKGKLLWDRLSAQSQKTILQERKRAEKNVAGKKRR